MKKSELKFKREKVIDILNVHGWKPNTEYLRGHRDWMLNNTMYQSRIDTSTGRVEDEYFLISPDNKMAVTLGVNVIRLHDVNRNYCKVFSAKYSTLTFTKDGLQYSHIKILY